MDMFDIPDSSRPITQEVVNIPVEEDRIRSLLSLYMDAETAAAIMHSVHRIADQSYRDGESSREADYEMLRDP